MLLAIDVGNTQTVLGLYEPTSSVSSADAGLVDYWRIGTDQDRTSDEHAVLVRNLLRQSGRDLEGTIKGVAVCAGVPRVLASLRDMVNRYVDEVIIHGSPSKVIDKLHELNETISLDYLLASILSHESFIRLTDEVLPNLKS